METIFCCECRFWERDCFAGQPRKVGQCRINPPRFTSPIADCEPHEVHRGTWPLTDEYDWCGQAQREDTAETEE